MKAIILAIGDELISGKTVDTNSAYLAEQLTLAGIETVAHRTIGDDAQCGSNQLSDVGGRGPKGLRVATKPGHRAATGTGRAGGRWPWKALHHRHG